MSEINKKVGERIKEFMHERGLTQEQLAFLADLHRAYVGQIQRGEKNIGLKNLEKIAKALEVDIREFFDFIDNVSANLQAHEQEESA